MQTHSRLLKPKVFRYAAFISFRGADTRPAGFVGFLHRALTKRNFRTFLDDRDIRLGDQITIQLPKAIEESRCFIIVLSENYASSSFCLDELVKILLELSKGNGRWILPVFFYVNRKFGEALDFHKKNHRVTPEKLEEWTNALTTIVDFSRSGLHLQRYHPRRLFLPQLLRHRSSPSNPCSIRWDLRCLEDLPEYMKLSYESLLKIYEETEQEMRMQGKIYALNYSIKEYKKVVQAYMTEARWANNNYTPTTEEYMQVATVSCGYLLLTTTSYIGMGNMATQDIFNWVTNEPKIINSASVLCRLMDDIVSNEFEQKRGHVASFLECYMKQYDESKEAAIRECRKRIGDAWKDINEECLRPIEVPMPFLAYSHPQPISYYGCAL